jgi:flagellar capping protein FliD
VLNKITSKKYLVVYIILFSLGALTGFGGEIDPSKIADLFSATAENQITQAGFFFTLAAWIHSGRVKKEIKSNFEALTTAINQVADAFKEDLKSHKERLDKLDSHVEVLNTRVARIEPKQS